MKKQKIQILILLHNFLTLNLMIKVKGAILKLIAPFDLFNSKLVLIKVNACIFKKFYTYCVKN